MWPEGQRCGKNRHWGGTDRRIEMKLEEVADRTRRTRHAKARVDRISRCRDMAKGAKKQRIDCCSVNSARFAMAERAKCRCRRRGQVCKRASGTDYGLLRYHGYCVVHSINCSKHRIACSKCKSRRTGTGEVPLELDGWDESGGTKNVQNRQVCGVQWASGDFTTGISHPKSRNFAFKSLNYTPNFTTDNN